MDILIKDATIITQNAKREILAGDVFISGNKVMKVGKNLREKTEEKIDGRGKLAFPGFVNAHTHAAMTLFRGYGEEMRLQDWLAKKIWPVEAKLKPRDVYWGVMIGIAEMIRCGTTAFNEMYVVGLEKIAEAAEKSGIRGSIGLGMLDKVPGHEAKSEMWATEKFATRWKNRNGRVNATVSCHAPYSCSAELVTEGKEFARKNDLQFHIHASETRKEVFDVLKEKGKRPLEYLDGLGALDERTVVAHAVYVTNREIALMGKRRVNIAHCPISNMKLAGGGVSPVSEFAREGANVTLGTDGAASNNSLNMIETMKMAALLQKNFYWDPTVLSAQQALDFATINGAKALGINAGCIEPGKLADIVLVDLKAANMNPRHDLVANVVYSMNTSNISDVIVDGEFVMKERKITAFDEEKIAERAAKIAEEACDSEAMTESGDMRKN